MINPTLSEEQIASFKLNGFLLIPDLIPEKELIQPDKDSINLIERGINSPFGDDRYNYVNENNERVTKDNNTNDREYLYRINRINETDMPESFTTLLAYPPLLKAVEQLMGGDIFACSVHALVFKTPHSPYGAKWHQDPVKLFRYPTFNADVYLDKSTPENGGLWAFPGSHLTGYHDPKNHPDFISSWTKGKPFESTEAVPVNANRGDVIFHATSVVHGSDRNYTDQLRRTVYYHFDHLLDVQIAGDQWPQNMFDKALEITKSSVVKRAQKHPNEEPYDYKTKL